MYRFMIFANFMVSLVFPIYFAVADDEIELGHLFDSDQQSWYSISFRCSELVPYFYSSNENDSLSYVLQYWEEETGVMEPVRRAWLLSQIAQNSFEPDYLSDVSVDDFIDYQSQFERHPSDTSHWSVPGDKKAAKKRYYISADFNRFTQSLAAQLLSYSDLSDDEYLLCLFYSHQFDEFYRLIKTAAAKQTRTYQLVHRYKNSVEKFDLHYGFFLGYWTPRTSLSLFGNKMSAGGLVGVERQRLIFDCSLLFQFPGSENPYTVKYEDDFFTTTHYFRFYFGVEPAFKLYDWKHTRVNLLSGAGIDVVEVVPEAENPYNEEPISIAGPNFNLGIGIQHYVQRGRSSYVQGELRYEFVSYNSHGGTDLANGEAVSIRLGFFWDANKRKHEFRKYFESSR